MLFRSGVDGVTAFGLRQTLAQAQFVSGGAIEAVATENPDRVGKTLPQIFGKVPRAFENIRVIPLESAVRSSDADIVYSALPDEVAKVYNPILARDRILIEGSTPNFDDTNMIMAGTLFSAGRISEFLSSKNRRDASILNVGSSAATILSTALMPLKTIGIESVRVDMLHSWSSLGYTAVPEEFVDASAIDFERIGQNGAQKSRLETEPQHLLSSHGGPLSFAVDANTKIAPWLRGDHFRAAIKLRAATTLDRLEFLLDEFQAPGCLGKFDRERLKLLPDQFPIELVDDSIVRKRDRIPSLRQEPDPMTIKLRIAKFDEEQPDEVVVEGVGDNLSLGSSGSMVMAGLYAAERGLV